MGTTEGGPAVHRECKPGACQYAGFDEDGETTVELPSGKEVSFPGCPAKHIDTDEVGMWLGCYRWLNRWKKTPVEMGLVTVEQLDPRYYEAMEVIDAAREMLRPKEPRR